MSRCPTDGPVLKSILGLYRPAADCLPSFLLFLNLLSLSISTNLLFFFFSHPVLPDPSLFLPLSPLQCQSPVPYLTPSFSSLSYRWPHPAIFLLFFLASYGFITQITLSALTLCVSLSLSFPPLLSFLFLLSNSHSLTLSWCFSLRQLMENKITTIERGAFQDLKELERL